MLLNLYLTPALVYGWFRWKSDSNTRPVTHVQLKWVPVYLLVTAVAFAGAYGIANALGGGMLLADSIILVGTMLAQFLLDNKKIETWPVWVIVNIAAIYTYFNAGLALAGFQYIFFLLNAFYGYYMWNKSKAAPVEPEVYDLGPDPLDPHGDGTLQKGDPMYDVFEEMMKSDKGVSLFTINEDGTWTKENL